MPAAVFNNHEAIEGLGVVLATYLVLFWPVLVHLDLVYLQPKRRGPKFLPFNYLSKAARDKRGGESDCYN